MFKNTKTEEKTIQQEATTNVDSLIGERTRFQGDLNFQGGLHVDGEVKGKLMSLEDGSAMLTLSESGLIEGEAHVPHMHINGRLKGDIHSSEKLVLSEKARIDGNVYYRLLEIAVGAEINGQLIHVSEKGDHMAQSEKASSASKETGDKKK